MAQSPASLLTTSTDRRNARKARLSGSSMEERALSDNLLRLRAVLLVLAARHGCKLETARRVVAEIKTRGVRTSIRSVHRWRARYLRSGFAGIVRRRRSDRDCPRAFAGETIPRVIDAALRVKRHGDASREFRKLGAPFCYHTFLRWIRWVQRELHVIEIPEREDRLDLLL